MIISQPKTIVLILSYNGKYLLEECINSYLKNNYTNFEVVVIDNGSTDKTREWVEGKWDNVKVLRTEKNLGYSGGLNFGMDYAFKEKNADYVLITNNDVKADENVISELVKVAETNEMIGFVTGKVYYYDSPNVLQTVGYYEDTVKWIGGHLGNKEKDNGQYDNIEERPFSDDIFMLVKKNVYKNVGGYDIEFKFQWEQFDWQVRAKKAGFKIYYTPEAKIWHKESMTIGKSSSFKTYFDVRNSLVIFFKHKSRPDIKKFHRQYLKNTVIIPFLKNFLKLKWNFSFAIAKGYLSAFLYGKKNKKI